MPRIDVPFIINKQHITQPTRERLAAGGQNYFYATFKMCEQWDDLTDLKAVFVREGVSAKLMPLIEVEGGFECEIPWEVMAEKGSFNVGIFGGNRLLTGYAYVIVTEGCVVNGEAPAEPTLDWFGIVEKSLRELSSNKADKDDIFAKEDAQEYIDEQTEIIKSDIEGLQKQINEEAHFRGYVSTNAKIQSMEATPNDFAYSAESGTKWIYDEQNGWQDSGTPVPDQLTPASETTPLINGVASVGSESSYARGDHRHPTDVTRVGFTDYATNTKAGVVKVATSGNSRGIIITADNTLQISCAERSDILGKASYNKPITPVNLEYAVEVCTNQDSEAELTEAQLKLPPSTQFLKDVVGDIESGLDNIIAIQNSLIGGGSV